MSSKVRTHLRSNLIGYLALFVAMSGTAYAANTVGSADVIDNSLRSVDLRNNDVRSADVRDDALPGGGLTVEDLGAGSVGSSEVADGALQDVDVAAGAIGSDQLADGAVEGSKLDLFSVSSSKIFPNSVTGSKLADGSVRNATIDDDAVSGAKIADGAVAQNDIGSSAVDASELGALTERTVAFGVRAGGFASATVSCQSAEQVISGGFDLAFPNQIKVTDFRRNGNGWRLQAFNVGGAGDLGGTNVYAYCLNPGF